MSARVLVLGYFGYESNQLDGQTIKTRNVYKMLQSNAGDDEVSYFDTQSVQSNKRNLITMLRMLWTCDRLFYLPAHNNLKYVFPFVFFLCKLRKVPIEYVVVGGWLADFLHTRSFHRKLLSRVHLILPQTDELTQRLRKEYGFENVYTFPNFRIHDFIPPEVTGRGEELRLVFMARIRKMKGIDLIFAMLDELMARHGDDLKIRVDFYGPVFSEDEYFFEQEVKSRSHVEYHGTLAPEDIYQTLCKYDALLLPTRYYTEGFPGSVLDAYIAGIPVVVSKWRYADEFVDHEKSGLVANWDDPDDFIRQVERLYSESELLAKLRVGAIQKARHYSMDRAIKILEPLLI